MPVGVHPSTVMKHQTLTGESTYSPRETFAGVLATFALGPLAVLAVAAPAALVAVAAVVLLARPAARAVRNVRTDADTCEDPSIAHAHAR